MEGNVDIQRLIELKKQRPSFSRTISWEMGRDAGPRKNLKTRKSGDKQEHKGHTAAVAGDEDDDEGDDDDDDNKSDFGSSGSDYETAFEDLSDELEIRSALGSIATTTNSDMDDSLSEAKADEEAEDDKDSLVNSLTADTTRSGPEPVAKRRLSKHQKRKKRALYEVTFAEEFVNLGDLFDTANDIETVFAETSDASESVEVSCRVPTLSELCLQAAMRKRHRSKSGRNPNAAHRVDHDDAAPANKEDPDETAPANRVKRDVTAPSNTVHPKRTAQADRVDPVKRVDPDETAPTGAVSSGSTLLARSSQLPHGIKRIMSDWQSNQTMLDKQLAFVQNFILPSLCVEKVLRITIRFHYTVGDINAALHFPVRSCWSAYPIPTSSKLDHHYQSSRCTAYLYCPTVRELTPELSSMLARTDCVEELDKLFISSTHVLSAQATTVDLVLSSTVSDRCVINTPSDVVHNISALATTVDLMLSSTVSDRCRSGSSSSDSEAIASATLTMIGRVKHALRSRYPQIVDQFYDRVMPYVMWARGNVGLATQMFQTFVSKETRDVYKAMYLSEIAVMHAMFRETEMAAKFHRLAAEVALTNISSEQIIQEATEQTQVLLAGLHDTGVLSVEKANAALQCWSSAVHLATPKPATTLGAADSLLGLHLAHLTQNHDSGQCWVEAERRLKSWVGANKYLLYYVAMVMALAGKEAESTSTYKELRTSIFMVKLPGEELAPFLKSAQKKNPWSPLVAMVRGQREPVKPLTVMWRTQLRPPRLSTDRAIETDLCSPNLSLRVSESGHLTGDIQMLMPPIREVLLDLHTGSLVLNHLPSFTGVWSGPKVHAHDQVSGGFMLPTPHQIYHHDNGTCVHLVAPTLGQCHRKWDNAVDYLPTCPMVLTWRGLQGRTAKINLVTIVKMAQKKELEDLKTVADIPSYIGADEEKFRLIKASIDIAYNKNLSLGLKDLFNAAYNFKYRHRSALQKAERRKKRQLPGEHQGPDFTKEAQTEAFLRRDLRLGPRTSFRLALDGEPLQFGQSLMVRLLCKRTENKYYLFLDCSSREAFLDYKLHQDLHEDQRVNKRRRGTNSCHDKLFCYRSDEELFVYNGKGEREAIVDIEELQNKNHPKSNVHPCIIGEHIYGCTKDRLSIWKYHVYTLPVFQSFPSITTDALVRYWPLGDYSNSIVKLCALGTEVEGRGQFLFVHLTIGLALMDPDTMELLPIAMPDSCPLSQSDDGRVIKVEFPKCKLLAEKSHMEEATAVYRFVIGAQNKLFLFSMEHKLGSDTLQARLLHYVFLPGLVKEAAIVGKDAGVLVSLTQHQEDDDNYREHVFHLSNIGLLSGVLLCLGRGPHSFCPVYMGANTDGSFKAGWYVYLRDGRDGIMCVKLFT